VWDTTRYTDWQKELLGGSASITDVQISVGGGNSFTNFRLSSGYHKEGMIFPGNFGFQRITGSLDLNHRSRSQKFRTGVTLNYGLETNRLFNSDITGTALTLAPDAPALYDTEGNLNWQNSTFSNPLAGFKATDINKGANLIINGNLAYEWLNGLTAKVNLGYNTLSRNGFLRRLSFAAQDPARIADDFTGISNFTQTIRSSWIIEPQLVYHRHFRQHEFDMLAGASMQESNSIYQMIRASGYSSDMLMESLQSATKINYLNDDDSQYRYMAVFGRIGYKFKQKYLVNLTGRRDGSSRFGPDHRWGNFGALGAAWIFSEEDFMKQFSFLSLGKIRTSYGVTGSDQIGDYQYLSTYQFLPYSYQGKISLAPTGLTNADYAWEETRKLETALEIGLLHDRIRIETAFYRNRCSNQLLNYPLPGITGFTGVTENLNATVQNKGWEISVQTINIEREQFHWTSSFNLTLPKNTLLDFPNIEQSPYANLYKIGQPLTISKVYHYLGVNPTTGLYQVADVNGDGVFDQQDQVISKNISRRVYGGLGNTLRFKGLELSFLFQFAQLAVRNSHFDYAIGDFNNIPFDVYAGRWQYEGTSSQFQKASVDSSVNLSLINARGSDAAYYDVSFARLKTLSVSYSFVPSVLDRFKLNACKIYVQGQNLFMLSNASGGILDPETSNLLPPLRMFTFGIDVKL
jgi:TonB-linked SusC/RagA family outer membrane protein